LFPNANRSAIARAAVTAYAEELGLNALIGAPVTDTVGNARSNNNF
tara:strand:+ start:1475 stop:1612 length:138 start_codon:yes stop_codon:yes gene_type:complete